MSRGDTGFFFMDAGEIDSGEHPDAGPSLCRLTARPATMDLGTIELGFSVERSFEIHNLGPDPCVVSAQPSGAFRSLGLESALIHPGESREVRFEYAPIQVGDQRATIEVASSFAPQSARFEVLAAAASRELLIAPQNVDFGAVEPGCNAETASIAIYNLGESEVALTHLRITGGSLAFAVRTSSALPASIPPAGRLTIVSLFRPQGSGSFEGRLELDFSGGSMSERYYVPLRGVVEQGARRVDRFVQTGRSSVDVLFVLDDAASSIEARRRLIDYLGSFLDFPRRAAIDYQLGVTTTACDQDCGHLIGAPGLQIITDHSGPSAEHHFARNATITSTSATPSRGLQAAARSLGGLARFGARLVVVVVSAEDDRSVRASSFFADRLPAVKGSDDRSAFGFVAISGDATCGQSGLRYHDVARRTGGEIESICPADWPAMLARVSEAVFGRRSRFPLSFRPRAESIEVTVDGAAAPYGYDPIANQVVPGRIPDRGSRVHISYVIACR